MNFSTTHIDNFFHLWWKFVYKFSQKIIPTVEDVVPRVEEIIFQVQSVLWWPVPEETTAIDIVSKARPNTAHRVEILMAWRPKKHFKWRLFADLLVESVGEVVGSLRLKYEHLILRKHFFDLREKRLRQVVFDAGLSKAINDGHITSTSIGKPAKNLHLTTNVWNAGVVIHPNFAGSVSPMKKLRTTTIKIWPVLKVRRK